MSTTQDSSILECRSIWENIYLKSIIDSNGSLAFATMTSHGFTARDSASKTYSQYDLSAQMALLQMDSKIEWRMRFQNDREAMDIGAVPLSIPLTDLHIQNDKDVKMIDVMRTTGPSAIRKANETYQVSVSIVFPDIDAINNQLRHIIAQSIVSPILPIRSKLLTSMVLPFNELNARFYENSLALVKKFRGSYPPGGHLANISDDAKKYVPDEDELGRMYTEVAPLYSIDNIAVSPIPDQPNAVIANLSITLVDSRMFSETGVEYLTNDSAVVSQVLWSRNRYTYTRAKQAELTSLYESFGANLLDTTGILKLASTVGDIQLSLDMDSEQIEKELIDFLYIANENTVAIARPFDYRYNKSTGNVVGDVVEGVVSTAVIAAATGGLGAPVRLIAEAIGDKMPSTDGVISLSTFTNDRKPGYLLMGDSHPHTAFTSPKSGTLSTPFLVSVLLARDARVAIRRAYNHAGLEAKLLRTTNYDSLPADLIDRLAKVSYDDSQSKRIAGTTKLAQSDKSVLLTMTKTKLLTDGYWQLTTPANQSITNTKNMITIINAEGWRTTKNAHIQSGDVDYKFITNRYINTELQDWDKYAGNLCKIVPLQIFPQIDPKTLQNTSYFLEPNEISDNDLNKNLNVRVVSLVCKFVELLVKQVGMKSILEYCGITNDKLLSAAKTIFPPKKIDPTDPNNVVLQLIQNDASALKSAIQTIQNEYILSSNVQTGPANPIPIPDSLSTVSVMTNQLCNADELLKNIQSTLQGAISSKIKETLLYLREGVKAVVGLLSGITPPHPETLRIRCTEIVDRIDSTTAAYEHPQIELGLSFVSNVPAKIEELNASSNLSPYLDSIIQDLLKYEKTPTSSIQVKPAINALTNYATAIKKISTKNYSTIQSNTQSIVTQLGLVKNTIQSMKSLPVPTWLRDFWTNIAKNIKLPDNIVYLNNFLNNILTIDNNYLDKIKIQKDVFALLNVVKNIQQSALRQINDIMKAIITNANDLTQILAVAPGWLKNIKSEIANEIMEPDQITYMNALINHSNTYIDLPVGKQLIKNTKTLKELLLVHIEPRMESMIIARNQALDTTHTAIVDLQQLKTATVPAWLTEVITQLPAQMMKLSQIGYLDTLVSQLQTKIPGIPPMDDIIVNVNDLRSLLITDVQPKLSLISMTKDAMIAEINQLNIRATTPTTVEKPQWLALAKTLMTLPPQIVTKPIPINPVLPTLAKTIAWLDDTISWLDTILANPDNLNNIQQLKFYISRINPLQLDAAAMFNTKSASIITKSKDLLANFQKLERALAFIGNNEISKALSTASTLEAQYPTEILRLGMHLLYMSSYICNIYYDQGTSSSSTTGLTKSSYIKISLLDFILNTETLSSRGFQERIVGEVLGGQYISRGNYVSSAPIKIPSWLTIGHASVLVNCWIKWKARNEAVRKDYQESSAALLPSDSKMNIMDPTPSLNVDLDELYTNPVATSYITSHIEESTPYKKYYRSLLRESFDEQHQTGNSKTKYDSYKIRDNFTILLEKYESSYVKNDLTLYYKTVTRDVANILFAVDTTRKDIDTSRPNSKITTDELLYIQNLIRKLPTRENQIGTAIMAYTKDKVSADMDIAYNKFITRSSMRAEVDVLFRIVRYLHTHQTDPMHTDDERAYLSEGTYNYTSFAEEQTRRLVTELTIQILGYRAGGADNRKTRAILTQGIVNIMYTGRADTIPRLKKVGQGDDNVIMSAVADKLYIDEEATGVSNRFAKATVDLGSTWIEEIYQYISRVLYNQPSPGDKNKGPVLRDPIDLLITRIQIRIDGLQQEPELLSLSNKVVKHFQVTTKSKLRYQDNPVYKNMMESLGQYRTEYKKITQSYTNSNGYAQRTFVKPAILARYLNDTAVNSKKDLKQFENNAAFNTQRLIAPATSIVSCDAAVGQITNVTGFNIAATDSAISTQDLANIRNFGLSAHNFIALISGMIYKSPFTWDYVTIKNRSETTTIVEYNINKKIDNVHIYREGCPQPAVQNFGGGAVNMAVKVLTKDWGLAAALANAAIEMDIPIRQSIMMEHRTPFMGNGAADKDRKQLMHIFKDHMKMLAGISPTGPAAFDIPLIIQNNLANMMGIKHCVVNSLSYETVPNAPDSLYITVQLSGTNSGMRESETPLYERPTMDTSAIYTMFSSLANSNVNHGTNRVMDISNEANNMMLQGLVALEAMNVMASYIYCHATGSWQTKDKKDAGAQTAQDRLTGRTFTIDQKQMLVTPKPLNMGDSLVAGVATYNLAHIITIALNNIAYFCSRLLTSTSNEKIDHVKSFLGNTKESLKFLTGASAPNIISASQLKDELTAHISATTEREMKFTMKQLREYIDILEGFNMSGNKKSDAPIVAQAAVGLINTGAAIAGQMFAAPIAVAKGGLSIGIGIAKGLGTALGIIKKPDPKAKKKSTIQSPADRKQKTIEAIGVFLRSKPAIMAETHEMMTLIDGTIYKRFITAAAAYGHDPGDKEKYRCFLKFFEELETDYKNKGKWSSIMFESKDALDNYFTAIKDKGVLGLIRTLPRNAMTGEISISLDAAPIIHSDDNNTKFDAFLAGESYFTDFNIDPQATSGAVEKWVESIGGLLSKTATGIFGIWCDLDRHLTKVSNDVLHNLAMYSTTLLYGTEIEKRVFSLYPRGSSKTTAYTYLDSLSIVPDLSNMAAFQKEFDQATKNRKQQLSTVDNAEQSILDAYKTPNEQSIIDEIPKMRLMLDSTFCTYIEDQISPIAARLYQRSLGLQDPRPIPDWFTAALDTFENIQQLYTSNNTKRYNAIRIITTFMEKIPKTWSFHEEVTNAADALKEYINASTVLTNQIKTLDAYVNTQGWKKASHSSMFTLLPIDFARIYSFVSRFPSHQTMTEMSSNIRKAISAYAQITNPPQPIRTLLVQIRSSQTSQDGVSNLALISLYKDAITYFEKNPSKIPPDLTIDNFKKALAKRQGLKITNEKYVDTQTPIKNMTKKKIISQREKTRLVSVLKSIEYLYKEAGIGVRAVDLPSVLDPMVDPIRRYQVIYPGEVLRRVVNILKISSNYTELQLQKSFPTGPASTTVADYMNLPKYASSNTSKMKNELMAIYRLRNLGYSYLCIKGQPIPDPTYVTWEMIREMIHHAKNVLDHLLSYYRDIVAPYELIYYIYREGRQQAKGLNYTLSDSPDYIKYNSLFNNTIVRTFIDSTGPEILTATNIASTAQPAPTVTPTSPYIAGARDRIMRDAKIIRDYVNGLKSNADAEDIYTKKIESLGSTLNYYRKQYIVNPRSVITNLKAATDIFSGKMPTLSELKSIDALLKQHERLAQNDTISKETLAYETNIIKTLIPIANNLWLSPNLNRKYAAPIQDWYTFLGKYYQALPKDFEYSEYYTWDVTDEHGESKYEKLSRKLYDYTMGTVTRKIIDVGLMKTMKNVCERLNYFAEGETVYKDKINEFQLQLELYEHALYAQITAAAIENPAPIKSAIHSIFVDLELLSKSGFAKSDDTINTVAGVMGISKMANDILKQTMTSLYNLVISFETYHKNILESFDPIFQDGGKGLKNLDETIVIQKTYSALVKAFEAYEKEVEAISAKKKQIASIPQADLQKSWVATDPILYNWCTDVLESALANIDDFLSRDPKSTTLMYDSYTATQVSKTNGKGTRTITGKFDKHNDPLGNLKLTLVFCGSALKPVMSGNNTHNEKLQILLDPITTMDPRIHLGRSLFHNTLVQHMSPRNQFQGKTLEGAGLWANFILTIFMVVVVIVCVVGIIMSCGALMAAITAGSGLGTILVTAGGLALKAVSLYNLLTEPMQAEGIALNAVLWVAGNMLAGKFGCGGLVGAMRGAVKTSATNLVGEASKKLVSNASMTLSKGARKKVAKLMLDELITQKEAIARVTATSAGAARKIAANLAGKAGAKAGYKTALKEAYRPVKNGVQQSKLLTGTKMALKTTAKLGAVGLIGAGINSTMTGQASNIITGFIEIGLSSLGLTSGNSTYITTRLMQTPFSIGIMLKDMACDAFVERELVPAITMGIAVYPQDILGHIMIETAGWKDIMSRYFDKTSAYKDLPVPVFGKSDIEAAPYFQSIKDKIFVTRYGTQTISPSAFQYNQKMDYLNEHMSLFIDPTFYVYRSSPVSNKDKIKTKALHQESAKNYKDSTTEKLGNLKTVVYDMAAELELKNTAYAYRARQFATRTTQLIGGDEDKVAKNEDTILQSLGAKVIADVSPKTIAAEGSKGLVENIVTTSLDSKIAEKTQVEKASKLLQPLGYQIFSEYQGLITDRDSTVRDTQILHSIYTHINSGASDMQISELIMKIMKPYDGAYADRSFQVIDAHFEEGVRNATRLDITSVPTAAYPAFKLYFIEEDNKALLMFNDFFSYAAVQSLDVYSSRKQATDIAVLTVSNVYGNLTNIHSAKNLNENPFLGPATPNEDINSIMLKPGCMIQIRMGYRAILSEEEIVFTGEITEVSGDEVLHITAQGYGSRLTQVIGTGRGLSYGGLLSFIVKNTGKVEELIWNILSELNDTSKLGHRTMFGNVDELLYDDAHSKWESLKRNMMMNTFTALIGTGSILAKSKIMDTKMRNVLLSESKSLINQLISAKWLIYNETAWESLQDLTLQFANAVCTVRPMDDESTLIMADKDDYYQNTDVGYGQNSSIMGQIKKLRILLNQGDAAIGFIKSNLQKYSTTIAKDNGVNEIVLYYFMTLYNLQDSYGDYTKTTTYEQFKQYTDRGNDAMTKMYGTGDWENSRAMISAKLNDQKTREEIINTLEDVYQNVFIYETHVVLKDELGTYGSFSGKDDVVKNMFETYEIGKKDKDGNLVIPADETKKRLKRIRAIHGIVAVEESVAKTTIKFILDRFLAASTQHRKISRTYYKSTDTNIIENNIQLMDGYNQVDMSFLKKNILEDVFDSLTAGFLNLGGTNVKNINKPDTHEKITIMASPSIRPSKVKTYSTFQKNAGSREMIFSQKKYVVGNNILANLMKDYYGGDLIILGDPYIKPLDRIYMQDKKRDMWGLIGVEAVHHTFSKETGFVTHITPDLETVTRMNYDDGFGSGTELFMLLSSAVDTGLKIWAGFSAFHFFSGMAGKLMKSTGAKLSSKIFTTGAKDIVKRAVKAGDSTLIGHTVTKVSSYSFGWLGKTALTIAKFSVIMKLGEMFPQPLKEVKVLMGTFMNTQPITCIPLTFKGQAYISNVDGITKEDRNLTGGQAFSRRFSSGLEEIWMQGISVPHQLVTQASNFGPNVNTARIQANNLSKF